MSAETLSEALEACATKTSAPALHSVAVLKLIQDSAAQFMAISHFPLMKVRHQLKNIRQFTPIDKYNLQGSDIAVASKTRCTKRSQLVDRLNKDYGPPSITRLKAMQRTSFGLYKTALPGITRNKDLLDRGKIGIILETFISRSNDLKIIDAVTEARCNAFKYAKYISVDTFNCLTKCVPESKLDEYVQATNELIGCRYVPLENNDKKSFTQTNSLHKFSLNGLNALNCVGLSHFRIYPGKDENSSPMFVNTKAIKLVSKSKHNILHSDIYERGTMTKHNIHGLALCTTTRTCYNYVTLNENEIKNGITVVQKGCDRCTVTDDVSCIDGFYATFFPDGIPDIQSYTDHTHFVNRVKSLAPIIPHVICPGCIIYFCCHHQHHDNDVLYRYIRDIAVPLLATKANVTDIGIDDEYLPPVV